MNQAMVLIVDDVETSIVLLRSKISELLIRRRQPIATPKFLTALNGQQALSLCEEHKIDLLYLDIELPDIQGIEVLKTIKQRWPDSFVVMVSAQSTLENVQATIQAGADGFIAKPFATQKIKESLERFYSRFTSS